MGDKVDRTVADSLSYRLVAAVDRLSAKWLQQSVVGRFLTYLGNEFGESRIASGILALGAPDGGMERSVVGRFLSALFSAFARRLKGIPETLASSWIGRYWEGSWLSRLAQYEVGILFLLIYLPLSLWLTTLGCPTQTTQCQSAYLPYAIKWAAELVLLLMFVRLVFEWLTGQRTLKWTAIDGPVFVWLVICLISAVMNGDHFVQTAAGLRAMFQYYLLAIIVSNAGLDRKRIKTLVVALFVLVAILGLHGVYQWIARVPTPREWVDVTETNIRTRAFGTMANPNTFGGYLSIFAAPLIALWSTKLSPKYRFGLIAALFLVLAATAFTYSRSSWMALGLAMLLIGALKDRRFLLAIVLGALIVPIVSPALTARLAQGFSTAYFMKSSTGGRIDSWVKALEINQLNPLFGVGPGQFGGAAANFFGTKAHLLVGLPERHPLWVDSQIFQYIAEIGFLGLLCFVWILVTFFRCARDLYRRADEHTGALVLGFAAAMLGLLLQSVFASMWEMQQITSIAWFGMALVCTIWRDRLFGEKAEAQA